MKATDELRSDVLSELQSAEWVTVRVIVDNPSVIRGPDAVSRWREYTIRVRQQIDGTG